MLALTSSSSPEFVTGELLHDDSDSSINTDEVIENQVPRSEIHGSVSEGAKVQAEELQDENEDFD